MAYTIDTIDTHDLDAVLNAAFDEIVTRIELFTQSRPAPEPQTEPAAPAITQDTVDLFRRALEYITEHPAEHDQTIWARRTETGIVGCLGYHAARLAGHTMDWERGKGPERCFFCGKDHRNESSYVVAATPDGITHVSEAAQAALGLTHQQADRLFDPSLTVDEQWRLAGEFTNGAIVRKENV
jgi:hypothetical protein